MYHLYFPQHHIFILLLVNDSLVCTKHLECATDETTYRRDLQAEIKTIEASNKLVVRAAAANDNVAKRGILILTHHIA